MMRGGRSPSPASRRTRAVITAARPPRPPWQHGLMDISPDEYEFFVQRAIDGMTAIVGELGDQLACVRPDLPGANSPYVILRHCLAILDYWGGHVVAGRDVVRDRDAEFTASGPVGALITATAAAKRRFAEDLATAQPASPPRRPPLASTWPGPVDTQGHALLHILQELAQHHGQAELTRDVLLAGRTSLEGGGDQARG